MRRLTVAMSCLTFALSGCAIVELGVRNPVPGLETVAIVPFFNLSQDSTVDGREFALAYYSELQKVPGFEVLPVGVAERAVFENRLEMNGPEDALTLAKILDVDAVVVGAVTDFDAYNPRIGLKVSWYSPQQWLVLPNRPVKSKLFRNLTHRFEPNRSYSRQTVDDSRSVHALASVATLRAQSPDSSVIADDHWTAADARVDSRWSASPAKLKTVQSEDPAQTPREFKPPLETRPLTTDASLQSDTNSEPIPEPTPPPPTAAQPAIPDPFAQNAPVPDRMLIPRPRALPDDSVHTVPALMYDEEVVMPPPDSTFDPHEPLMAYVRIFDSSDRRLVARLADYLELSGESRSGDLEAWMQRTEFFRKFTAHVMISEMLTLHGGESRRRLVLKPREYR